jgi:hypothetical protein
MKIQMNPNYPVYIISKGRHTSRLTSKALERIGVPYRIVVEPQEAELYASVIDESKVLVLPFSNLGQGSIPARNWVWEHAIAEGHKRHWILDDNIEQFNRMNRNLQVKVADGTIFKCAEDFVDRYTNIALAGFQYDHFAKAKAVHPAFTINTRIYSCSLIDNALPLRWRGKYNEDTDLSIRILKSGLCTCLFYAFIQQKAQTMTTKGGNTDELYKDDGRLKMAQSLVDQHPDITKVTWKFNRWQHQVDYRVFKENELIKVQGFTVPDRVNNYGMELVDVRERSGA